MVISSFLETTPCVLAKVLVNVMNIYVVTLELPCQIFISRSPLSDLKVIVLFSCKESDLPLDPVALF